jgi:hypothetical protein
MAYLVFATEPDAQAALAVINDNMGFPSSSGTTTTWSDIYFSVDNTWFFEEPDAPYMVGVPATYTEVETPPQRYYPPTDN